MTFTWNPEKDAVNRRKHAVGFREAASVLEDPLSTTYPDPAHSRGEPRGIRVVPMGLGRYGEGFERRQDPRGHGVTDEVAPGVGHRAESAGSIAAASPRGSCARKNVTRSAAAMR